MSVLARTIVLAVLASIMLAEPASAYIGPGAGLSMLSAFWALIVAVFSALGFLILYPLRRLFGRRDTKKTGPVVAPREPPHRELDQGGVRSQES
jgi:membrane protein implicated in regulation of membrane protease activity